MADYSPVYSGGVTPFTQTTSAAVTGGQVLEVTATGTVGPATAATVKPVGVAAHDAASWAATPHTAVESAPETVTTLAADQMSTLPPVTAPAVVAVNGAIVPVKMGV